MKSNHYSSYSDVPLLQRSLELWKTLDKYSHDKTGLYLLKMTGGIMIGSPDSIVIRGIDECGRK